MAADGTIRPTHGGYQDAFPEVAMRAIAREIAGGVMEQAAEVGALVRADTIRAGQGDDEPMVLAALAALKWRFYAQPHFRAAVAS